MAPSLAVFSLPTRFKIYKGQHVQPQHETWWDTCYSPKGNSCINSSERLCMRKVLADKLPDLTWTESHIHTVTQSLFIVTSLKTCGVLPLPLNFFMTFSRTGPTSQNSQTLHFSVGGKGTGILIFSSHFSSCLKRKTYSQPIRSQNCQNKKRQNAFFHFKLIIVKQTTMINMPIVTRMYPPTWREITDSLTLATYW